MQEDLYNILLTLADDSLIPITRMTAGCLLGMLPTWAEISTALKAALIHPAAAEQLALLLCPPDQAGVPVAGQARLLYLTEVPSCKSQYMRGASGSLC